MWGGSATVRTVLHPCADTRYQTASALGAKIELEDILSLSALRAEAELGTRSRQAELAEECGKHRYVRSGGRSPRRSASLCPASSNLLAKSLFAVALAQRFFVETMRRASNRCAG